MAEDALAHLYPALTRLEVQVREVERFCADEAVWVVLRKEVSSVKALRGSITARC